MAKRDPLQVSPNFRIKIIQLQSRIKKIEEKKVSIRELTERIANTNLIEEMEKKLLQKITRGDININFDARRITP